MTGVSRGRLGETARCFIAVRELDSNFEEGYYRSYRLATPTGLGLRKRAERFSLQIFRELVPAVHRFCKG